MAGYIIMFTLLIFTDYIISTVTLIGLAYLKEWYDEFYRPSSFDWADAIWTLMGGILALSIYQFGIYIGVL
jgi:hypothetical protein